MVAGFGRPVTLVCAIEHLRKQAKNEAHERTIQDCFAGIEKKHLPHILCMTNLLLHGIDESGFNRMGNKLRSVVTANSHGNAMHRKQG